MNPCCVIFDDQFRSPDIETYDALNAYVVGGGKLIMCSWLVDVIPHPLWATLGVDQSSAVEVTSLTSLYQWNWAHPIFRIPNSIPNPLSQVTPKVYGVDAITEKVIDGGTALGGITSSPADGQAFIVVANYGRTLLNTFLLDEVHDSKAVDMMENEITFVCVGRQPPVGGELVSNSAFDIGSVLSSTFLTSITVLAAVARPY